MEHLRPGGWLVINAIRKEDTDQGLLADLDYPRHLWLEKEIRSVVNVYRSDVRAFLKLAAELDIRPQVGVYPLEEANRALIDLKSGAVRDDPGRAADGSDPAPWLPDLLPDTVDGNPAGASLIP